MEKKKLPPSDENTLLSTTTSPEPTAISMSETLRQFRLINDRISSFETTMKNDINTRFDQFGTTIKDDIMSMIDEKMSEST